MGSKVVQLARCLALAVALNGDAPPTEFRIFTAGVNATRKGEFLFDEESAASVMAAYEEHGIDIMIDLEHLSLDTESKSFDPDARGWCKLEVRAGELWAVDVTWTDDGVKRLSTKTQRYISPVFDVDEDGRILRLFNVAITALPATDNLVPLMAASKRARDRRATKLSDGTSLQDISRAVEAVLAEKYPSDDPCKRPWVCDVFDATVVYELEGKFFEAPYTFDGAVATVAEGVPVKRAYQPIAASERRKKGRAMKLTMLSAIVAATAICALPQDQVVKLAEGEGSAGEVAGVNIGELAKFLAVDVDPAQDPAGFVAALKSKLQEIDAKLSGGAAPAPAEPPAEDAAAMSAVLRLTQAKSPADAVKSVEALTKLALEHAETVQKLAKEAKAIETTKRRQLTARLVVCGAELPATAWSDEEKTKPAAHLEAMSLEQLEQRALAFEARGPTGGTRPLAPDASSVQLSEREQRMLAEQFPDPKVREQETQKYAARKAALTARKAG